MEGEGLPQCQAIQEPKGGMIRESRSSNLSQEIRYFSLTVMFVYLVKVHSKWEGLYLVLHAADHGTVTLQCDDRDTFKANGEHLKLFLEPNPQDSKEVDVLNFLKIQ
jgi:hypothetical protein